MGFPRTSGWASENKLFCSNKMQLSNYTVVNCLLGLYGQWRGFREFAAECAGIKKTNLVCNALQRQRFRDQPANKKTRIY